jgi:hypothetical protein
LALGGGVVHGDIETPESRNGPVHHIANVLFLANIGVDELGLRTQGTQLLGERVACLVVPTGDNHLRAMLGKRDCRGAADACEGSRDQND